MITKKITMKSVKKSSFTALVKYITDDQNKEERVDSVRVTNCHQDNPEDATLEIQAVQAMNKRAVSDKTYHMVVSFPAGETPSKQTLHYIEDELCKALGYEDHQRISAVHSDTDNLHIHIAINKIHPEKLTIHDPHRDYKIRDKVCVRLEKELGLVVTNHESRKKGSENRASDMESHSGQESLLSWIKRECLEEIKAADSWENLHKLLAEHGLVLQLKGNGFVITSQDGVSIKASSADRKLSKPALEKKLGPFQSERRNQKVQTKKTYQKRPVRTRIDTSDLYAKYKDEQAGLADSKKEELARIRRKKEREIAAIKRSANFKRASIKLMADMGVGRKLLYSQVSRSTKKSIQEARDVYSKELKSINEKHKRLSWADWLKVKAEEGDEKALAALRAREKRDSLKGNTITGAGEKLDINESALAVDSITKKGTVIRTTGEASIRDDGKRVQVRSDRDGRSILAALHLTLGKYGNKLTVTGSKPFIDGVVDAVVSGEINASFSDKNLEKKKLDKIAQRGQGLAVESYITERNEKRIKLRDIPVHRRRIEQESGDFLYSGVRKVNGCNLALLKKGNEMIVHAVTAAEVRRLKRLSINAIVELKPEGTIITTGKTKGVVR